MNAELSRPAPTEAPARPRELWPAATLATMMLLILVLSVHLVLVSARLGGGDPVETYSDGSGPLATLSVARIAAAVE